MVKVESIMKREVLSINSNESIQAAIAELARDPQSCVVVKDGDKPHGIITGSDIIRYLANPKIKPTQKAATLMSTPVMTINHNASIEKASKVIDTKKHSNYPVKKDNQMVGIVSESDIVRAVNDNMRFHRNIQNIVLVMFLVYAVGIVVVYGHLLPL